MGIRSNRVYNYYTFLRNEDFITKKEKRGKFLGERNITKTKQVSWSEYSPKKKKRFLGLRHRRIQITAVSIIQKNGLESFKLVGA